MNATTLPERMQVVRIAAFGGVEGLELQQQPVPQPGTGEVLVKVYAAGVSRPDVLQRMGLYPPPPGVTDVPGLEVAGVIVAVGEGVARWKVGDEVCALLAGGGYAEFAVVPQQQLLQRPEGWSWTEAASLPENLFTAWENLVRRGGASEGQNIMVLGGAGGIGTLAIMIGKVLGARVFTTAGSAEKRTLCESLGAERAFDYRNEDIVTAALDATEQVGMHVVLDMVGGDYIHKAVAMLAMEGRIVMVGSASTNTTSAHVTPLPTLQFMRKRATLTGTTLRNRSPAEKGVIGADLEQRLWPLLPGRGVFRPVIDSVFAFADVRRAHQRMDSGEVAGKVVLDLSAE